MPGAVVTTIAGTGASSPFSDNVAAASATLSNPTNAVPDSYNNIYVADDLNNRSASRIISIVIRTSISRMRRSL